MNAATMEQNREQVSDHRITRSDVESLVREPSSGMRTRIVEKISTGYHSGMFSPNEIAIANEIFRLIVRDTERRVRVLLSQQLKNSLHVPHDIIFALANDVSHEVATPVLEHSHVLSEQDLIAIVHATREHPRLMAIASRDSMSKELSHALVEKHDAKITKRVIGNQGASLADSTLQAILDDYARDNSVLEELVVRGGLPYSFAEKLFSLVSDSMKKQLTHKYRMRKEMAEETTISVRETATLQFLSPWMSQQDINQLIDAMDKQGRLSDSVIIRSLCIGDLRFFETAIAKRAGVPSSNARILIVDPGALGFKALYYSSGLPENFYEAVHAMLKLAQQETEYGKYRSQDFGQIMIHAIQHAGLDKTIPNMDALMGMIHVANSATAAEMVH